MFWHIELKLCIWLCFTVLQIKLESFFVGVTPLLELKLLEIQFSALFSYMLWHIELKFCKLLCFTVLQSKFECRQFLWELCPFWNLNYWKYSFPHFSPTCFDILSWNFRTWLCSNVLQIKFECRQFASSFVGVMPLLELRILEIHSFPHFSLTCFDILSWNFAYDFVLLYYRSSSSVVNLRQFL